MISSAAKAFNPNKKITATLDSPPFFLEKHLDYLKDKYCEYFEESTFTEIQNKNLIENDLVKNSNIKRPRKFSNILSMSHGSASGILRM